MRDKGYIRVDDKVKSFPNCFPVAKTMKTTDGVEAIGEIRTVYEAAKSGLNETVWNSWFSLPTIESELRAVRARTLMCDCDVGECF